jgi:hypothetical protein
MQGNMKLDNHNLIRNRFLSNRKFLCENQKIWEKEVLNYFPESLDAFPKQWVEEISKYTMDQIYQLDGKQSFDHLPDGEFKQFVEKCREMEILPRQAVITKEYPSWAWNGVKGKKKHEITQLVPVISELTKEGNIEKLIDIGGGVGHLARILAHYEGHSVISIDMNPTLQEKGKKRISKYPLPVGHGDIDYYCCEFNDQFNKDHLVKLPLTKEYGMIGLHTCGNLANDFLYTITKTTSKAGLNLGCCYLKLDPKKQTNLSQTAKDHPLNNTKYSLTLATRGHLKLTREEFDYKIKVKRYRYLLHLWFLEQGINKFVSVGDSPPRDYALSFAGYVKLKMDEAFSKDELTTQQHETMKSIKDSIINEFFDSKEKQGLFWNLFYCDLIRWQVGRLLEIDILLDRALFAWENQHEAEIFEIFDESISPRNIALKYKKRAT